MGTPQNPATQLRRLDAVDMSTAAGEPVTFSGHLAANAQRLEPATLEILQLNLGKLCNMSCVHCHVGAGPDRHDAVMDRATVEHCLRAVDATGVTTVDLTGGAPEMNPHFRWLVEQLCQRPVHIIDRCNLTVLLLPEHEDLPGWLAARGVEVVSSLPHFRPRNTDALRGAGTYERSLQVLRRLNEAGYGQGDPDRVLTLMANPAGAFLAGNQASMEGEWKTALKRDHGVTFDRLIALNNMPMGRFLQWLEKRGQTDRYLGRLLSAFNPATVAGLMCRNTLSVAWDGGLYDCDFNQMLELQALQTDGSPATIEHFDADSLARRTIRTDRHCFGCTAGSGSSCGGATAD